MSDITKPAGDHVAAAGMKRRTILAGAAWSVPVIAVATSAPAFAATETCPNLSQPSSWTVSNNGYVDEQGYFDTIDGRKVFVSNGNNTSNSSQQAVARVYLTASMPVEAGKTYTFTWDAYGNYGNFDKATSQVQYSHLSVDGSQISDDYSTRADFYGNNQLNIQQQSDDTRPWKSYSSVYKATETKTVQVQWEFILPYPDKQQTSSDDIYTSLPAIACS
ncbi:hypothetical protein ACO03V_00670 [Microbacterium sp. HMH0099]|uniref:hypothetical protein n=1 Tax=Microbacterium sp. HMH0099 TaxID=3414026 RepID=UPI003BF62542